MREIKFRIWDEEERAMWYSDRNNGQEYCLCHLSNDGKLRFRYGVYQPYQADGEVIDNVNEEELESDIIMQYTGLKENAFEESDKNKEIYDGDIIEFINGERLVVEWNDDTCQWQYSDGSPINNGERYATHKAIVGNVHQHPELLTPNL